MNLAIVLSPAHDNPRRTKPFVAGSVERKRRRLLRLPVVISYSWPLTSLFFEVVSIYTIVFALVKLAFRLRERIQPSRQIEELMRFLHVSYKPNRVVTLGELSFKIFLQLSFLPLAELEEPTVSVNLFFLGDILRGSFAMSARRAVQGFIHNVQPARKEFNGRCIIQKKFCLCIVDSCLDFCVCLIFGLKLRIILTFLS